MIGCPCKGCDHRAFACHGKCAEYIEWSRDRRELLRKRFEESEQYTKKELQPFWRRMNQLKIGGRK